MKFDPEGKFAKRTVTAAILAPIALILLYVGGMPFKITMVILTLLMLYEFYTMCMNVKPSDAQKIKYAIFAVALIVIPMCILTKIRTVLPDGLAVTLWLILSVWASDIGAYFVGLKVGGPKLAPTISPKKTWAGLAGACFSAIIVGHIFHFFYDCGSINFAAAGYLIGIIGQMGDLVESKFKRIFNVKDSGNLIPGHGGILDRTDSILAAAYYILILLILY